MNFADYQCVLLDLDGTLLTGDAPVPGAAALVQRLREREVPIAVISNTSKHASVVADRLGRAGMAMPVERIWTAVEATCEWALHTFGSPRVFNLCTDAVPTALGDAATVTDDGPVEVVISGDPSTPYCTPDRQQLAVARLRGGAMLAAICEDRAFPSSRGLEIGAGALARMLAYAANVTPVYCGKPEPRFFNTLCDRLSLDATRCVLIGDNPDSDIAGAKIMGMRSILLRTPLATHDGGADVVIDSLDEL